MSGGLRTQVGQLARRSVLRTLRQPAQIVPALIFPMFLLAVNSGGLKDATNLPGFPTDSYLTFALAVPFMQGALFSVINAGTDLARDIETGFLNRLALTPLRGVALLSGLLAGAVVLGLLQAVTYLVVGLTAGADLAAGDADAEVDDRLDQPHRDRPGEVPGEERGAAQGRQRQAVEEARLDVAGEVGAGVRDGEEGALHEREAEGEVEVGAGREAGKARGRPEARRVHRE